MPKSALQKLADKSAYSKSAAEKLDWSYYDTYTLNVAVPVNRLFTIPLGQAGKTLADTNFVLAGQLAQGQNFTIFAIKPFYKTRAMFGTQSVQEIYDYFFNTTVEFIITGKDSMGTWTLAELFGVSTMIGMVPTAASDNIPLISPDYKGIFPLNVPITIGATGTMELRVTHHVPVAQDMEGTFLKISLQGKLIRMS